MPRTIGCAVLAGFVWLAMAVGALADDKPIELKISHWVPPSHPLQAAIQDWADSVTADSHGSITSVIFPAEQLGKAFDHYDMARDGIADIAYVNPGYQPGRFPIIALVAGLSCSPQACTPLSPSNSIRYVTITLSHSHLCKIVWVPVTTPGRLLL